jgi:hypothetical protein
MGHKKRITNGRCRIETGEKKARTLKFDGEKNEKANGGKSPNGISQPTQV